MESTVLWNRRIKNSLKCSASVRMGIFLWNAVELSEKGQKLKKFDVTIDVTQIETGKSVKSRGLGFEVDVLQQKYNKFTTHNA